MDNAQRAQLLERGYVVIDDIVESQTLNKVRNELHAVVDKTISAMHAEGKLPSAFKDAGFDYQLAKVAEHDTALAREVISRIHGDGGEGGHMGPGIFQLITHETLMEHIEDLVGPEIIGSSVYRIRPKAPGLERGAVPWHQDSGYFLAHCDRTLVVTCWIPLVDATVENGCLYVMPNAHGDILRHHTEGPGGYLIIEDEDLPTGKPIPLPMPTGSVLFMTNLTPHCSYLNHSDQVRWSVDLRYQDATVPNNVGGLPSEINWDDPNIQVACYPPEADFVLRSPQHPEREVRTWQQLHAIRQAYFEDRKQHSAQVIHRGRWTTRSSR